MYRLQELGIRDDCFAFRVARFRLTPPEPRLLVLIHIYP